MPSTRSHLEDFNFPSSTVWSPVYPSKYFSCKVLTNHLLLVYAITAIHVCPPRFVKYSWLHQQGFELHGTIHTQFFFSIVNPAVLHTVGWILDAEALLRRKLEYEGQPQVILEFQGIGPRILALFTDQLYSRFFIHHNELDTRNHILCRAVCLAQVLRVFIYLIIIC